MRCARCNEEYQGQHACRVAVGEGATLTLAPVAHALASDDDSEISVDNYKPSENAPPAYPKPVDDRLPAGTMVGEYRIEEMIGKGGMGQVYSGTHPVIGKKVAIKVLDAQFARDTETLERFISEARAVNRIGHPNIVDIFAFGQLPDGRPYFCMEFLPGLSLRERLKKGSPLTYEETIAIFLQITSPLAAAHEVGIIHRDLKPDNILLVESKNNRQVKLLDFGVAKLLDHGDGKGAQNTSTGLTLGTPTYMSPEQCLCKPVDPRSDIYSLGVILFVVTTGTRPFGGQAEFQVLEGHVHHPPPKPSSLAPVPEQLEELILKCLEKDPAARPQSASEVAQALEALLEQLPVDVLKSPVRASKLGDDSSATPILQPGFASKTGSKAMRPAASATGTQVKQPAAASRWPIIAGVVALLGVGGFFAMKRGDGPRAEPVSEVMLQVISEPGGATVKIDGRAQALLTPNTFKVPRAPELPVVIELEGYEPYAQTVKLGDKETEKALKMKLKPLKPASGRLAAQSNVAKAQWTLDGSPVGDGSGKLALDEVPVGMHVIGCDASGYDHQEETVDIEKGAERKLSLTLQKSKPKRTPVKDNGHRLTKRGPGEANDITGWPPK